MYVLCSPCILQPELRAKGITKPADLEMFEKTLERCRTFGIEIVPLPCPETLFLGPDREPGTFLDRLNTQEFSALLLRLGNEVRETLRQRGPPLCILGVNSSPACGVNSTYYGSLEGKPPKREGRGVFLSQFPDIPALDVSVFSRYRIYLAAPLFSEAERQFNQSLSGFLEGRLFEIFLPQEAGDDSAARDNREQERLFLANRKAIDDSDYVVAVIDGPDADSGTAWEMGYAFARGIPVIALRTDFRRIGHHERVNLMLEQSAVVVGSREGLAAALGSPGMRNGTAPRKNANP